MSSNAKQGMLKRPRVSTISNVSSSSARRPPKRKKDSGEFNENNQNDNNLSSDESDCPTLLRSPVNGLVSGARGLGKAPQILQTVYNGKRVIRHSKSLGRLVPRGRGAIAQKGVGRTRSASPNVRDSSSDDEIDILGEERRRWKQSRGGALGEPRPGVVESRLNQNERAIGSSTVHRDSAPTEGSRRQSESSFSRPNRDYISSYQSLGTSKYQRRIEDDSKSSEDRSETSEDSSEEYKPIQETNSSSPGQSLSGSRNASINAAEDLGVGSSGLCSNHEEIHDDPLQAERLKATLQLGAEDKQIQSLFENLGLPLSPDRIPINAKSDGKNVEYHTASTVTQEVLIEHGSWEFPKQGRWNVDGKRKIIHTEEAYVPISLDGELLDIMVPPTDVDGTGVPGNLDLASNIHAFLDGRKVYIEGPKNKIYLDEADATDATLNDNVDSALLMPVQYQKILDDHEKEMELRRRNLGWGVDPSLGDSLPQSSPPRCFEVGTPESNSQQEKGSFSASQGSPSLGQPCRVQDSSVPTNSQPLLSSIQASSVRKPSKALKETPPTLEHIGTSVAEALIEQHKLKPTLADAQELERMLREMEPEYARRRSRQRLCQRTGTVAGRSQLRNAGQRLPLPTIEYASKESIERSDKERRVGNATTNRNASNPTFGAAERVLKWIDLQPLKAAPTHAANDSKGNTKAVEGDLSEVAVETHVGPLVKGIFWDHPQLKESENKSLRFLDCLRLFGTNPKPDYAACLSGVDWLLCGLLLALCLLSGECKPSRNFGAKTEAQMAMNSVATLVMLILMHLSTRKSADQKLLPWMFIYAFCYTELGITIYAHFPKFVASPDGKGGKWKFVSWQVTSKFSGMWAEDRTEALRMSGLATLYLLRSHTEFVLEQLLTWSKKLPRSVLPIIDILTARSHVELGQWDWLIRKVHEGNGKLIEAA